MTALGLNMLPCDEKYSLYDIDDIDKLGRGGCARNLFIQC